MKRDFQSYSSDDSFSTDSEATDGAADHHGSSVVTIDGEDLRQRVQLFLAGSNIPALRQVRVTIEGDAVVMCGTVHTYYEKQMAIQFAQRVAGVIRTIDRIDVRSYVPAPRHTFPGTRRSEGTARPSEN